MECAHVPPAKKIPGYPKNSVSAQNQGGLDRNPNRIRFYTNWFYGWIFKEDYLYIIIIIIINLTIEMQKYLKTTNKFFLSRLFN